MRRYLMTSVPHHRQRYKTVGDWTEGHGFTLITVSEIDNEDYEVLIALHEFLEYVLCKKRGIKQEDVDAFDIAFEQARERGEVTGEPGHDLKAPYRSEHIFAELIERKLAKELGVDWDEYERTLAVL